MHVYTCTVNVCFYFVHAVKSLSCCVVRVMTCLMSSVDKPEMTDDCKTSLMEVFYFISRDFRYVEIYL